MCCRLTQNYSDGWIDSTFVNMKIRKLFKDFCILWIKQETRML